MNLRMTILNKNRGSLLRCSGADIKIIQATPIFSSLRSNSFVISNFRGPSSVYLVISRERFLQNQIVICTDGAKLLKVLRCGIHLFTSKDVKKTSLD